MLKEVPETLYYSFLIFSCSGALLKRGEVGASETDFLNSIERSCTCFYSFETFVVAYDVSGAKFGKLFYEEKYGQVVHVEKCSSKSQIALDATYLQVIEKYPEFAKHTVKSARKV